MSALKYFDVCDSHLDGVLEHGGVLHLDSVLEHGVVKLAESEAKAAANLRQADCELTNRRPVISTYFSTMFFLFCINSSTWSS